MSGFAGGSGAENDPYIIETGEQFMELYNLGYVEDIWFEQIDDIELPPLSHKGYDTQDVIILSNGHYEGNNHTMEVVWDERTDPNAPWSDWPPFVSIFDYIYAGSIRNLHIEVDIYSEHRCRMGLLLTYCWAADGDTLIENITIEGSVTMQKNVSRSHWAGGMFSEIWGDPGYNLTVRNCEVNLDLTFLDGSYTTNPSAGGLVYWLSSYGAHILIEKCAVDVNITGAINTTGGFTGQYLPGDGIMEIKDCYVRGSIKGAESSTGGFGGWIGVYGGDPIILKNIYIASDLADLDTEHENNGAVFGEFGYAVDAGSFLGIPDECYIDGNLAGIDFNDYFKVRTTGAMTFPPNWNTTYINWDFENIWAVNPAINDGYPYFYAEAMPFPPVPGYLLRFIEPPTVRREYPKANRVIVKSPSSEYTATSPEISEDHIIERLVEIDAGSVGVCREVAERLLERWSRINVSVEGEVRLAVGLSFKEKVKVFIDESNLSGEYLPLRSAEHNVVDHTTRVVCGDIILSDEELLARILDDLAGKW